MIASTKLRTSRRALGTSRYSIWEVLSGINHQNNERNDEILDEVHDYARLGGAILFGTDAGYLPEYDPTTEYVLMQSAGLGWREILASLTTAPAARFGEASRRGRIVPGMDADLVVLGADPVTDIRAFTNVRHAVRAGRVIYSSSSSR